LNRGEFSREDSDQSLSPSRPGRSCHRRALILLLSDAARWINGVNLPIDGGLASTYI
jgi:hypothetical protein